MNCRPTAIEDARRRHNQFRRTLNDGLLHLSPGLLAFDRRQQDAVIDAVRTFEAFDDDPDDDHAIGDLELPLAYDGRVRRELIFFRIHRNFKAPRATGDHGGLLLSINLASEWWAASCSFARSTTATVTTDGGNRG